MNTSRYHSPSLENRYESSYRTPEIGSVARGNADRASDIDIQIIVADDLTAARRDLQDARQSIEEKKFDGERYELQVLVESIKGAKSYGEKLQEIFSEGIVLYSTDELDNVREAVFDGR